MMFDLNNDVHLMTIVNEAYSHEQEDYRRTINDQWRILRDDLAPYVKSLIKGRHPVTYDSFEVSKLNFARKITKKRSMAYKEDPRRILGSDEETITYEEMLKESKSKWQWRIFDTYFNYFRYSAMWFQVREKDGVQKTSLMSLMPSQFFRIVDDYGDTVLFGVYMGNGGDGDRVIRGDGQESLIQDEPEDNEVRNLAIWTDTQHAMLEISGDQGKLEIKRIPIEGNELGKNDLGKIPATFAQEGDPRFRPAFNALATQTLTLNYLMSVILTGMPLSIFGNMILKRPANQEIPDEFAASPYTYYDLPQVEDGNIETSLDYITPPSNVKDGLEVFEANLKAILDENDVKGGESMDGQDYTSGFHLALSKLDTTEVIKFNQEHYTDNEKEMYQIFKAYDMALKQNKLRSEDITIIFKEPDPVTSKDERIEQAIKLEQNGFIEPHEKFVILDPSMDLEAAKEKQEVIDKLKAERVSQFMVNGVADADQEEQD